MEEDKKKIVMIVVVVVCLVLAGALAIKNFGGGGATSTTTTGPQPMLCVNPDCGHIFEMSTEERRQTMRDQERMMMRRGGPPAFTCPQCGEESVYQANKCSKCSTVFIRDYTSDDLPDRCPECGYSAIEERRKQQGQ